MVAAVQTFKPNLVQKLQGLVRRNHGESQISKKEITFRPGAREHAKSQVFSIGKIVGGFVETLKDITGYERHPDQGRSYNNGGGQGLEEAAPESTSQPAEGKETKKKK